MTLFDHPSYFKSGEINSCELSPLPTHNAPGSVHVPPFNFGEHNLINDQLNVMILKSVLLDSMFNYITVLKNEIGCIQVTCMQSFLCNIGSMGELVVSTTA